MCPSGATCLPTDCCFNSLVTKCHDIVQSGPHRHLNRCNLLVLVTIYLKPCSLGIEQQPLAHSLNCVLFNQINPPIFFTEVSVPNKESERSYVYVLGISIFRLEIWAVPTIQYLFSCFSFHYVFINQLVSSISYNVSIM